MFSLTIKGKENPKSPQLVKLEMIFFKTGYVRVPKVLGITGPFSKWDNETQCFTSKSSEAVEKNKWLLDLKTKYLKLQKIGKRKTNHRLRYSGHIRMTPNCRKSRT